MYSQHFQQGMDQPGMVTNPGRGQLNRDFFFYLFLFAPENLVSRDRFGRPVPRQPVHSPHSGWIGCSLTGFLSLFTASTYTLSRHRVSPYYIIVYHVTYLRTDGVYFRESAYTGPVVLKVQVRGATFSSSPWIK